MFCSCPIYAVIEPSYTDNEQPYANQHDRDDPNINTHFEQLSDTSVHLAINWANSFNFPVTLYLYDGVRDAEQEAKLSQFVIELEDCFARLEESDKIIKD
jgi:hypothetical protein